VEFRKSERHLRTGRREELRALDEVLQISRIFRPGICGGLHALLRYSSIVCSYASVFFKKSATTSRGSHEAIIRSEFRSWSRWHKRYGPAWEPLHAVVAPGGHGNSQHCGRKFDWGAPKIHGELLKLGFEVCERRPSVLYAFRNPSMVGAPIGPQPVG